MMMTVNDDDGDINDYVNMVNVKLVFIALDFICRCYQHHNVRHRTGFEVSGKTFTPFKVT